MNDKQLATFVKDHKLSFVPGYRGYGADGKSIKQGVSVYDHTAKPSKSLGIIIIDPSNGTIEDTIPDGVIDPIKERILGDLKDTENAYCDRLYVLYNAERDVTK